MESQHHLLAVFENSLDAILFMDDAGRYVDGNPAACQLLGCRREELLQMTVWDKTPVQDRANIPDLLSWFRSQGSLSGERALLCKGGATRQVKFRSIANILPGMHLGILHDITERTRAEENLRRSEALLAETQQLAHIGSWNWEIPNDSVTWSDEHYRIFGLPVQSLAITYERFMQFVHPDDRAMVVDLIDKAIRERQPYECYFRALRADGTVRMVHSLAQTLFDDSGKPMRMFGTAQDITEQRRAQDRIRESEERLQLAVSAADLGVFEHDQRTDAVYWSKAMYDILGWSAVEPVTLPKYIAAIHPEDRAEKVAAIQQAHDPVGEGLYSVEHRIVRRDGDIRWVRVCSRTYFEGEAETRRPVRTIGTMADITQRKQAEESLRETSEFTRQVVNSVQEGLVVLDADFRYSLWNTYMENLSGKPARAVLGKRPWEVFHFLPEAPLRPLLESALSGVSTLVPDVYTDPAPPGRSAWVSQVLMPMRDSAGKVVGILCTLNDITARKKAEEARSRLAAIVESAADAIIGTSLDGIIGSWNAGAEKLFGYPAQDAIGRYVALIIPAERQEEEAQFLARVGRGESVENHETVRLHKSGRRVDVALSISPVRDSAGSVIGCAKIMHDVTTRKRLEKEVLEIASREQRRIGQVLHDTTGQELTALWLLAEALVKTLEGRTCQATVIAGKLAQGLQRTLSQVRGIARGLIPVEVDSQGLDAALAELAVRISVSTGVKCTLNCGTKPVEVDDNQTATHLFHIAQEAVTNALKHGKPTHITLALFEDDQAITLRIQDNGVGFPAGPVAGEGIGLKLMQHRAGLIHGWLTVGPLRDDREVPLQADNKGTAVTCKILKGTFHEQKHNQLEQPSFQGIDRGRSPGGAGSAGDPDRFGA